jgi:hypothetical protein
MRSRAKITTRNVGKLPVFLPRERGFHKDTEQKGKFYKYSITVYTLVCIN